jgi:ADP-ribosyl-[dinitrogen reductase] hydrolase
MPPPRRPAPTGPDPLPGQRSRGALLGLAIGDALGAPLRGRNLVAPPFPGLADGMRRHLGQGRMQSRLPANPFEGEPGGYADESMQEPAQVELRKGQVTDETQLACCIAWSLKELKHYDAADVARRYRAWKPHAFDMTDAVRESLEEMGSGMPVLSAGKRVWLRHHRKLFCHGSLSRTAPIGVFFAGNEQARIQASLEDSALTHYDPRCQLACAALNSALAKAITGGASVEKADILTAAKTGLSVGAATLARMAPEAVNETTTAKNFLWEDLDRAQQPDPMLYGPELHLHRHLGHVRVAFRLAFWEFVHAPSVEAGLVDVVNRGADADAHGAIAGALLGAFHGEEAIPQEWRRMVLDAMNTVRGPLWNTYHPRHLLALVAD